MFKMMYVTEMHYKMPIIEKGLLSIHYSFTPKTICLQYYLLISNCMTIVRSAFSVIVRVFDIMFSYHLVSITSIDPLRD